MDLAAAAHQNLLEYQERSTPWMPGGTTTRDAGLLLTSADLPFPSFRTAVPIGDGASTADAAAQYEAARRHLGAKAKGDGFSVFCRTELDDDLANASIAAGAFEYGAGAPEMVCAQRLEDVDAPAGSVIRRVDDAAGVRAYASIAGTSFATLGWPAEQITASFAGVDSLLRDDVYMFLASVDNEPVAAAMSVIMPSGGAYISWVATLDHVRGRGFGEAVTRAATNAGFDAGASFASLEASHMGEPVYARMGYDTRYRYRFVITLAR